MSETLLPLAIRAVPPGPGYQRVAKHRAGQPPESLHTGGVWVSPDGQEYWKPLDGRPWANSTHHLPTQEAECLALMAGQLGFPHNWRVAEAGTVTVDGATYTRRWLVRPRALVVGDEDGYLIDWLRLDQVLAVEQGLRALNERRWTIGDSLVVAVDQDYRPFVLDLSCAWPDPQADDEWRFLRWAEALGFTDLVRLRHAASRAVEFTTMWRDPHWPRRPDGKVDARYRHVYAARQRPTDNSWARLPAAYCVPAGGAETGVHTWVIVPEPLAAALVTDYELTWGWGPLRRAVRDSPT